MRWDWKVLVGAMIVALLAGWWITRSVHEPAIDLTGIDRDLTELAAALRTDEAVELEIAPRVSAGIHLPSSMQYRRASDFWSPVLGRTARVRGGRRRGRR